MKSQSLHIVLDAVYIFGLLGDGVRVVKSQVRLTPVVGGKSKVQTDAFGVAYMEIPIGLWRKTGDDLNRDYWPYRIVKSATVTIDLTTWKAKV